MNKTNIVSSFFQMLAVEFRNSEGFNKFLILAIAANIPLPWVFIPYGTQAITIILVALFIKQYRKVLGDAADKNMLVLVVSGLTLVVQLLWIPYLSQLMSLVLLGVLYNLAQKKASLPAAKEGKNTSS